VFSPLLPIIKSCLRWWAPKRGGGALHGGLGDGLRFEPDYCVDDDLFQLCIITEDDGTATDGSLLLDEVEFVLR
jgi:hypothetical protein